MFLELNSSRIIMINYHLEKSLFDSPLGRYLWYVFYSNLFGFCLRCLSHSKIRIRNAIKENTISIVCNIKSIRKFRQHVLCLRRHRLRLRNVAPAQNFGCRQAGCILLHTRTGMEIQKLQSCQEFCQLTVLASDQLITPELCSQSGDSLLVDTTLDNDYNS